MTRTSSYLDQTFADILDFVEERAREDLAGSCRLCPRDASLADVGTMAAEWVERLRGCEPTERQLSWTAWIAGIHHEHVDYRAVWDRFHATMP